MNLEKSQTAMVTYCEGEQIHFRIGYTKKATDDSYVCDHCVLVAKKDENARLADPMMTVHSGHPARSEQAMNRFQEINKPHTTIVRMVLNTYK